MSKSSRTDKGVHAGCTYIGGRFNLENKDEDRTNGTTNGETDGENGFDHIAPAEKHLSKEEKYVLKLNEILPNDIRCFKIQRVTKGFDARRKYEYVFPEWILMRRFEIKDGEHSKWYNRLKEIVDENMNKREVIKLERVEGEFSEVGGEYKECELNMERFNEIIKKYEGTNDFHNFTVKNKLESSNTQRYIQKISLRTARLDDLNVVKILIVGQSFLYNQIRKMVSMALQEYLNVAPENTVGFALNKSHFVNINIVPSEGLILHHPYYDSYNISRCNPPEVPFIDYKEIKSIVEEFKTDFIYPEVKRSIDEKIWEGWLENVAKYPFYLENNISVGGESVP